MNGTPERIRVVRGNPTPEELAAAVAVVQARAAAAAAEAAATADGPRPASAWSHPARTVPRRLPTPGPDAWRTSFWPS
ncbi:acyl-CoA carboxylase subunit epsilon [Streptomyces hainanensis]|uniref:Acyl-CoA carboxylase subunit epsilon n=1 Tax=Streptomyces hainanensis TaxID=402648 RepID=A0A4R4T0C2_9ACTN|nr:acyl-CoA carboxylase subunit epsilon [Streptomyces hainanensis]TDC69066.1 acyl-CoA carboxylase subunit epsilon [Streptomyces hainanensis]